MWDKEKARVFQAEIRRILLSYWDPIGVKEIPEATDEYDSYIGPILTLLINGASDTEIEGHLRRIEVEQMGFGDVHGSPLAHDGAWDEVVVELQKLRAHF